MIMRSFARGFPDCSEARAHRLGATIDHADESDVIAAALGARARRQVQVRQEEAVGALGLGFQPAISRRRETLHGRDSPAVSRDMAPSMSMS